MDPVRLACVRHAASVHPEPGSNSRINLIQEPFGSLFLFFVSLPKSSDPAEWFPIPESLDSHWNRWLVCSFVLTIQFSRSGPRSREALCYLIIEARLCQHPLAQLFSICPIRHRQEISWSLSRRIGEKGQSERESIEQVISWHILTWNRNFHIINTISGCFTLVLKQAVSAIFIRLF